MGLTLDSTTSTASGSSCTYHILHHLQTPQKALHRLQSKLYGRMTATGYDRSMKKEAVLQVHRSGEETVTVPATGGNPSGGRNYITTTMMTTSVTSTKRGKPGDTWTNWNTDSTISASSPLSAQAMNAVGVYVCEIFVVGTASQLPYVPSCISCALSVFSIF